MPKAPRDTRSTRARSRPHRTCPAVEPLAPSAASRPAAPADAPLDLEAFLREFDDGKLEALREAVEKELRRRGGAAATNPRHTPAPPKPGTSRRRRNPPPRETSLTGGQERWVRAALQAGGDRPAVWCRARPGAANGQDDQGRQAQAILIEAPADGIGDRPAARHPNHRRRAGWRRSSRHPQGSGQDGLMSTGRPSSWPWASARQALPRRRSQAPRRTGTAPRPPRIRRIPGPLP